MSGAPPRSALRAALVAHGLLVPTDVDGVYGRSSAFERVVDAVCRLLDGISEADGAERMRFPPIVSGATLEDGGYMASMPQFAGMIHSFSGDDAAHRSLIEDPPEATALEPTGLALVPAACLPLYPTCAGTLPRSGRVVDLGAAYVFRREPSLDVARLQAFRQREMVCLGEPERVIAWRELWLDRGHELFRSLALEVEMGVASDPFFGHAGRLLSRSQLAQKLKFELSVPIGEGGGTVAIASFNYHKEHFGETFGIRSARGEVAHSACLGFGMERVALALFSRHGLDCERWPDPVRERVGL